MENQKAGEGQRTEIKKNTEKNESLTTPHTHTHTYISTATTTANGNGFQDDNLFSGCLRMKNLSISQASTKHRRQCCCCRFSVSHTLALCESDRLRFSIFSLIRMFYPILLICTWCALFIRFAAHIVVSPTFQATIFLSVFTAADTFLLSLYLLKHETGVSGRWM